MSTQIESNLKLLGDVLRNSGCDQCHYYPGMKGHVLAETITPAIKSSLNERNAFEFGYGASLAGGRSVVMFKGVGLATCLDSVQHAVITGIGGGLVVILLEDTVAASSPEIVDSRMLRDYAGAIMIEPSSLESAAEHCKHAFTLSEELDVPVLIRLTYELLSTHDKTLTPKFDASTPRAPHIDFKHYRQKTIGAWADRAVAYEQKQADINAYIENIYAPQINDATDSFIFGNASRDTNSSIRIEHYPVAASLRAHYESHTPAVHELGSNYGLRSLQASDGAEVDNSRILADTLQMQSDWEKVLARVVKENYSLIIGDEGKYTFDSTSLIDTCLCMGSSIAVCAGASKYSQHKNLAVVGDFAYLFNAYPSIVEAAAAGVTLDILLLDDEQASSTGSQRSVATIHLQDIEPYVTSYQTHDYDNLPDTFMTHTETGIHVYHIKKHA